MSKCIYLICICIFLLYFSRQIASASSINLSESNTNNISNINQEYKVNVEVNINSPNETIYYLRGVFYKIGKSDYCGFTFNGKDWFKGPISSSEGWKNFLPIKISSSSAKVILLSRFDREDSGCRENGTYNFKVQRFTTSGSGQFDPQNEQSLYISIEIPTPTIEVTVTIIPTYTFKPTITTKPANRTQTVSNFPSSAVTINDQTVISEKDIENTENQNTINKISEISTDKAVILGYQTVEERLSSSPVNNTKSGNSLSEKKRNTIIVLLIIGSIFIFTSVARTIHEIRKNNKI
jgi:hypothetical protein